MVGYKWWCHLALETFGTLMSFSPFTTYLCGSCGEKGFTTAPVLCVHSALSWKGRIYVDNQPIHYCSDTGVSMSLCWFHLSYLCSKQDCHRGQSFWSCSPTADMHISSAIRLI